MDTNDTDTTEAVEAVTDEAPRASRTELAMTRGVSVETHGLDGFLAWLDAREEMR